MYDWRTWTPEERVDALRERVAAGRNWHAPHRFRPERWFHVTAACYEHRSWIAATEERILSFSRELLRIFSGPIARGVAWCVLPNHYHVLAEVYDPGGLRKELGRLHGRSSHQWNVEERRPGRKCFHRCLLKEVRSSAHWNSTLNYIHHNPVRHGYVQRWQEWPYSSAPTYLATTPIQTVRDLWSRYPITGMGTGWDE